MITSFWGAFAVLSLWVLLAQAGNLHPAFVIAGAFCIGVFLFGRKQRPAS